MSVIVLDTSILIDLLRGYASAVEFVRQLDAVPVCSEITRVEVLRRAPLGGPACHQCSFSDIRRAGS